MKQFLLDRLTKIQDDPSICGLVDGKGRIYPLGSDTKVLSTIFEIMARQAVADYAGKEGLELKEPDKQNYYPDFTLMANDADKKKLAIDVKTTYTTENHDKFSYTLGSYTSYIKLETEAKNIVYPYSEYKAHWVIGFVYTRLSEKRPVDTSIYSFNELQKVQPPFANVRVFIQEKWRIAGDKAGSGNTANIGSIRGRIDDFILGRGVFRSEDEFVKYWRGYERTAAGRQAAYSNIHEFRQKTKS